MDRGVKKKNSQIVVRDILDALDAAPKYPHQATFKIPYYKNQLVVRVMHAALHHYCVCQQGDPTNQVDVLIYFSQEPSAIETIIQESFVSIFEENRGWTDTVDVPDSLPLLRGF